MKKNSSSLTARAALGALFLIASVLLVVLAVNVNVLNNGVSGTIKAAAPATPIRTSGGLTFAPATLVDTQRNEGEPINHIDKDGNYWESGPWGFSTEQSFIHRSTDGGNQFNIVTPIGLRPNSPPGGGDTDVKTDDQGNAYFVDLEGPGVDVDCSVTNDNGNTWRKNTACIGAAGLDREWLAIDNGTDHTIGASGAADNTVFVFVRQQPLNAWHVYSSPGSTGNTDPTGGFVFQPAAGALPLTAGGTCGEPHFDPVNRNLYLPCAAGTNSAINTIFTAHVNVGQRTGLTFTSATVPGSGTPTNLFSTSTTDTAGNAYVVWTEGNHNIFYSYLTNGGTTWSTPIQVNSAPANTNVFCWGVAGTNGNLAVVWYGTDTVGDPSNFPKWFADRVGATTVKWYGYAALITNAATTTPTIDQNRYTEKPMHYGQVCLAGLLCTEDPNADRTMADFQSVNMDGMGRIRVVFNDTTNQHSGAQLFEARQLTGPSLIGTTLSDPAPSNPMLDPLLDAQWPHYRPALGPGSNVPQLDFTRLSLSQPAAHTLRIAMTLSDLSSLSPPTGKTNAFWMTRFQALSTGDPPANQETYRIFYVGAESVNGAAPTFFVGSGTAAAASAPFAPGNGCVTTTPQLCKLVQYPAETTVTGSVNTSTNTICIDVPNFDTTGFGTGRPINGNVLYNVTAFSGGRNDAMTDIYADVDATRSFDFPLGNVSAVPLVSVASRKAHGGAGTFDINLPFTSPRGVECRGSGATNNYTLVFTFLNNVISVANAQVTTHDPVSGTGTVVGSPSVSGNQVTVNLTNVSTGQYLTVTLNGVADVACNTGNIVSPQMGVLVGDVNADGGASNLDVSLVKAKVAAGASVDSSNFRDDVNADGGFSNLDVSVTKAQVAAGQTLPSTP